MRVHGQLAGIAATGIEPVGVDPAAALRTVLDTIAVVRDVADGITLDHSGWGRSGWTLQGLSLAAYLSARAGALHIALRQVPLAALNPVELAEQLATVDRAWAGRLDVALAATKTGADGTAAALAAHGIDTETADERFTEALSIVRRMWSDAELVGAATVFRFDAVQPTLRPTRPAGPNLALTVHREAELLDAGGRELGAHVPLEVPIGKRWELVSSWHTTQPGRALSVEFDLADIDDHVLAEAARHGVHRLDVRLSGDPVAAAVQLGDHLARWRA